MLQKSHRILLRNMTYGFCKNNNNTGDPEMGEEKPVEQHTHTHKKDKKKHKHAKNATPDLQQKKAKVEVGVNWAQITYKSSSPNLSHHQTYFKPTNFNNLLKDNTIIEEIQNCMHEVDAEHTFAQFEEYLIHYIRARPHDGYNFVIKKVIDYPSKSVHFLSARNKVYYTLINSLIQNSQKGQLLHFLKLIVENYHKEGGSLDFKNEEAVTATFEVLCQLGFHPKTFFMKYQILSLYLEAIKIVPEQIYIKDRLTQFASSVFAQFCQRADNSELQKKQISDFESFFRGCINSNLFNKNLIEHPSFQKILIECYFGQCQNDDQKYRNFFGLFNKIKASISSRDDYLHEFFDKMIAGLSKSRLRFTDCSRAGFPINKTFISEYKRAFDEENKELLAVCLAIAFDSNYLPIIEHFLEYHKEGFKSKFSTDLISKIKQEYNIKRLIMMQTEGVENLQQSSAFKQLQKSVVLQLKSLIITKDYEAAWKLFQENFYDAARLQKQKEKIKYVLNKHVKSQPMLTKIGEGSKQIIINQYCEKKLDKEFLRDGWKKSEDLGYLLESYYSPEYPQVAEEGYEQGQEEGEYVEQGEQVQQEGEEAVAEEGEVEEVVAEEGAEQVAVGGEQTAAEQGVEEQIDLAEKRFSFWDDYFERKRGLDFHKFQTLGQIDNLMQSEEKEALPYHFNLNQYKNTSLRDKVWQKGCQEAEKIDELKLHVARIEFLLLDIKASGSEKSSQLIKQYEENLSAQAIKKLEDFGLYNYDIELYDLDEYLQRIKTYKKYRGILRSPQTLVSPYQTRDQMNRKDDAFKLRVQKLGMTEESGDYDEQGEYQNEVEEGEQEAMQQNQQEANEQMKEEGEDGKAEEDAEFVEELPEDLVNDEEGQAITEQNYVQKGPAFEPVEMRHPQRMKIKELLYSQYGNYLLSKNLINLLRIKDRETFEEAEYYTKVNWENNIVNQMIEWGLIHKQPMSIYLAEKLACTLGQKIPHYLAIRVSDFFSHYREIDEERIRDCKVCLSVVGPIRREIIYERSKKYQHVTRNNMTIKQIKRTSEDLGDRLTPFLSRPSQLHGRGQEPRQKQKKFYGTSLY